MVKHSRNKVLWCLRLVCITFQWDFDWQADLNGKICSAQEEREKRLKKEVNDQFRIAVLWLSFKWLGARARCSSLLLRLSFSCLAAFFFTSLPSYTCPLSWISAQPVLSGPFVLPALPDLHTQIYRVFPDRLGPYNKVQVLITTTRTMGGGSSKKCGNERLQLRT